MPRKFFRRFLPSHDSIRQNRYVAWCGPWLQHHNLWHLHRRSAAGGVAAGLFAGLVPGVTLYSNPFTIVPLYFTAFKLGQLVMLQGGEQLPPLAFELEGKGFREWIPAALAWLTSVGKPLIVGLPLLALLLAVIGYFTVDRLWQLHVRCEWSRRRRRNAKTTTGNTP
jgi:uncharacterized protein (DUF2062 family)